MRERRPTRPTDRVARRRCAVSGQVQGVGFRPYVRGLADSLGVTGFVGNDAAGVFAEVQGGAATVGAVRVSAVTDRAEELAPVVIPRLRNTTAIDATGLLALEDLADKPHAAGRHLILCGARPQPAPLTRQAEFEQHGGRENEGVSRSRCRCVARRPRAPARDRPAPSR